MAAVVSAFVGGVLGYIGWTIGELAGFLCVMAAAGYFGVLMPALIEWDTAP